MHFTVLFLAIISTPLLISGNPLPQSDLLPLSSHLSTPLTRRSTQPPSPAEINGVLKSGQVINSPTWKAPSGAPTPPKSHTYDHSGPCTAYIVQNGFGSNVQYQAWFRDASNAAMGGMPTTRIGKTVKFPVGGGEWSIGRVAQGNGVPAKVMMTWQSWYGSAMALEFNPAAPGMGPGPCTFAGNAGPKGDGSVTYFQCPFSCGP